jgi:hypothetical protein
MVGAASGVFMLARVKAVQKELRVHSVICAQCLAQRIQDGSVFMEPEGPQCMQSAGSPSSVRQSAIAPSK